MTVDTASTDTAIELDPPTLDTVEDAVEMHDVNLSYGSTNILKNLCMYIPRGSIYGLLGPSGCGKTSAIRCILGMARLNSGTVKVFGQRPGTAHSMIPGPAVGYMPQDLSLYTVLTIGEILHYYGQLYNMPKDECIKQTNFLIDFLELPESGRRVGYLSGGQKRRVSLATALIHKPPLIILDEPTVGVDPLLRKTIWEHLIELSQKQKLTVLITTHYIEEAKDANMVGFMRNGRILEQDEPATLSQRYKLKTLEQVFLFVCQKDETSALNDSKYVKEKTKAIKEAHHEASRSRSSSSASSGVDSQGTPTEGDSHAKKSPKAAKKQPQYMRPVKAKRTSAINQMGAMCYKNFVSLIRNPAYMLFQFLLPTIEVVLFCLCIGRNLHSVPVAVYDGDNTSMSIDFFERLDVNLISPTWYATAEDAIDAVRNGHASTAIIVMQNFSSCLIKRFALPDLFADDNKKNKTLEAEMEYNATVHLYPDMSNQLMVAAVHKESLRSFQEIAKIALDKAGKDSSLPIEINPNLLEMPVKLEKPIYGKPEPPFTEFMAPGVILSITFLAAIPLTTMSLVVERKDGLIERSIVAGASHFYILLSHLCVQTIILVVQVMLLLLVVFPGFQIPFHGDFIPILMLTISQSFCGLAFGLLVSSISNNENTATMLSLGAFYPMLLLSGTVWPINAMSTVVKQIALVLPQTIPILSMRDMVSRGWSITSWGVAQGFLVTYAWVFVFLGLATIIFRRQQ